MILIRVVLEVVMLRTNEADVVAAPHVQRVDDHQLAPRVLGSRAPAAGAGGGRHGEPHGHDLARIEVARIGRGRMSRGPHGDVERARLVRVRVRARVWEWVWVWVWVCEGEG